MFYFGLYIINVYVILPPDLGTFAVNTYIHTNNVINFFVTHHYLGMIISCFLETMHWNKRTNELIHGVLCKPTFTQRSTEHILNYYYYYYY
jgi:hypothetical protein